MCVYLYVPITRALQFRSHLLSLVVCVCVYDGHLDDAFVYIFVCIITLSFFCCLHSKTVTICTEQILECRCCCCFLCHSLQSNSIDYMSKWIQNKTETEIEIELCGDLKFSFAKRLAILSQNGLNGSGHCVICKFIGAFSTRK